HPFAARAGAHKPRVELRRDLLTHLVTPPAYTGADPGPDEAAAELLAHERHRGARDPGVAPAPSGVNEACDVLLRVPQDDREAVGVRGEDRDARPVGDQGV